MGRWNQVLCKLEKLTSRGASSLHQEWAEPSGEAGGALSILKTGRLAPSASFPLPGGSLALASLKACLCAVFNPLHGTRVILAAMQMAPKKHTHTTLWLKFRSYSRSEHKAASHRYSEEPHFRSSCLSYLYLFSAPPVYIPPRRMVLLVSHSSLFTDSVTECPPRLAGGGHGEGS